MLVSLGSVPIAVRIRCVFILFGGEGMATQSEVNKSGKDVLTFKSAGGFGKKPCLRPIKNGTFRRDCAECVLR